MGLPITMTSARLSWTCSQYQLGVPMIEVGRMIRSFRHSFTDSQVMMLTKLWSNCALNLSVLSILKLQLQLLSKGIFFWRSGFPRFLKVSVGHILWLHDISPFEKSSPIRNNFPSSISWPFLFCHPQPHSLINFQTARNDSQICSYQPLPCQYTGWLVTLFNRQCLSL